MSYGVSYLEKTDLVITVLHCVICIIIKGEERLEDVTVVVSNKSFPTPGATLLVDPDYTLCAQYRGIPPAGSTPSFTCVGNPGFARYVYVYLPRLHQALTLCEVEVFAGGKFGNAWWRHEKETLAAVLVLGVRGIHWWLMDFPHKSLVMQSVFVVVVRWT